MSIPGGDCPISASLLSRIELLSYVRQDVCHSFRIYSPAVGGYNSHAPPPLLPTLFLEESSPLCNRSFPLPHFVGALATFCYQILLGGFFLILTHFAPSPARAFCEILKCQMSLFFCFVCSHSLQLTLKALPQCSLFIILCGVNGVNEWYFWEHYKVNICMYLLLLIIRLFFLVYLSPKREREKVVTLWGSLNARQVTNKDVPTVRLSQFTYFFLAPHSPTAIFVLYHPNNSLSVASHKPHDEQWRYHSLSGQKDDRKWEWVYDLADACDILIGWIPLSLSLTLAYSLTDILSLSPIGVMNSNTCFHLPLVTLFGFNYGPFSLSPAEKGQFLSNDF